MIAIIIPFRRRRKNLENLLRKMSELFGSECELIVIEQTDGRPFNRGALMNIGFTVSTAPLACFHDVDMLPINADYSPVETPTCLISSCNLYGDGIPYPSYFGGATSFVRHHFEQVNGFSNKYFGWGKEDDDLWIRCERVGLKPARRSGVFYHQDHPRDTCNTAGSDNEAILRQLVSEPNNQFLDGLNSLSFKTVDEYRRGTLTVLAVDL